MFGKDTVVTAIKLFIITAVAAFCLAFANKVTAPIIEVNSEKTENEALGQVLPAAKEFDEIKEVPVSGSKAVTIEKFNMGTADGETVGYVVTAVSHEGYGGDIKIMVGIDTDFAVTDIRILESSETAGLGAKAKNPEFTNQFKGQSGVLSVVKGAAGDNQISAISSATVTSRAVTNCVNAAVAAAKEKSVSLTELEEIKKEKEDIDKITQEVIGADAETTEGGTDK